MNITEAIENYLETILVLSKTKPDIHAVDICAELGFSRPTVSIMLKRMRESGLILVDDDNHIVLTDEGFCVAERVYERHRLLAETLMAIGVDRQTAHEDACKIEHDISDESFECLRRFVEKARGKDGK